MLFFKKTKVTRNKKAENTARRRCLWKIKRQRKTYSVENLGKKDNQYKLKKYYKSYCKKGNKILEKY